MDKHTCQMIISHHSDCTCSACRAYEDVTCGKPAVGTAGDNRDFCFVCDEHAAMALDDPPAYGNLIWFDGYPLLSNMVK